MNGIAGQDDRTLAAAEVRAVHYQTGRAVAVRAAGGRIQSIDRADERDSGNWPTIAPGLVDLQINGYAGIDINASPLPAEAPGKLIRAIWREGVTTCLPTVITRGAPAIEASMAAIARACESDPAAKGGAAGIHLEGPFISPEDGPRGAHDARFVRAPDWDLLRRWQDAAGGRIRLITLSPHWPGSAPFIARCAAAGITVAIGHTSATPAQIREAAAAGARLSTHLGNAAHLMLPRHPNYLWEQLAEDRLWASIIADGFHLPDSVLNVILKVKGEHAVLVSDAVSLSGMPPGRYAAAVGGEVVLTPEGRLHLAENDKLLAGSAQMLVRGIEHLLERKLAGLALAWEMASIRPAELLGLEAAGGLAAGAPADFVLFRRKGDRIELESTFKAGERVWERQAGRNICGGPG